MIRRLLAPIAAILLFGAHALAQQAGPVSQMPFASTPLSGAELLYIVQGGQSKKVTVGGLSFSQTLTIGATPIVGGTNGDCLTISGSFLAANACLYAGGPLGTPSSGDLVNATGYIVANLGGLGTGVATALGNAINTTGGLATYPVQNVQNVPVYPTGAKCDGSTDDTTALQAWAAAVTAGETIATPNTGCVFKSPITFPVVNNVTMAGVTLIYEGSATTGNGVTIGSTVNGCSVSGWTISLTLRSTTVMTSGYGLQMNDVCASALNGVVVGAFNAGSGDQHWYNGIHFNGGNSVRLNGLNIFSASNWAETVNGDSSRQFTDLFQNSSLVFTSGIGINIAGNVGGFYLDGSDVLENGVNVRVSQDVVSVANSQLFFGPQAIIDVTSGGAGIGIEFADPGGGESFATFSGTWLASSTNQCLKVDSSVTTGWSIFFSGGQIGNCNDAYAAVAAIDNESTANAQIFFVGTRFFTCCNGTGVMINNISGAVPITVSGVALSLNLANWFSGAVTGSANSGVFTNFYVATSGGVEIYDDSASNQSAFNIIGNATDGAGLKLQGNGSTTPSKWIRAYNGGFDILNSAYSLSLFHLTDAGAAGVAASLTTPSITVSGCTGVMSGNGSSPVTCGGTPSSEACSAIATNTTVTTAGCYVITTAGVTVTLGSFATLGQVTITDGTGNANPQITIAGTINGGANFELRNPKESVVLTDYPPGTTWTVSSIYNQPSNGTPARFMYFTGSNRVPVNQIIKFTNATDVGDWFGTGTQQAAAATTYFAGYTGPNAEFDVTRIPDGGARSRFESAPIQNLLAVLQTQCPYSATPACPMSLTYDIDQNVAPQGYTVSITPCFDTTSNCLPAPESISSSGSAFVSPDQATLAWATPIAAVPYPSGNGSLTISGSVVSGGTVSTLDGTYTGTAGTLVGATGSNITITSGATFNGTISGSTLTVNSTTTGTVLVGQVITGTGISGTVTILSGTSPTFTLSASLGSIGPEAMQATNTGTITSAGTITFNPSFQQVAANLNDSINTAIFNNPYAITTGSSVTVESCQMNAGTLLIGQFAYVTGTQSGCTLPIGSNINSTVTGVVIMAQEQGPPCAVGETSCTQSAASRSLTPQTPTPTGFFGCAPATGNFVPSGNCPGSVAGKYTIWTTACCLQYQVGPATSGPGSIANPFIAFWAQFSVGTLTGNGKIATGMSLAAANPAIAGFMFGGDGPGSTLEYGYCSSSTTDAEGDSSCPASGIWSYVSGGSVTTTPTGTFCVNTGCNGTSWVMPCGFAGELSGYAFCNTLATAINVISTPIQVTYAATVGADGTTGKLEVEKSAWSPYSMPYGTMQLPTGPGAVALNMAAGSVGIGSGGQAWSPWLTTTSQVMLSYTAFLSHFLQTVTTNFSGFQIPTDPDAYFGYNWQQQAIQAWAVANGYNYLEYFRLYPWALVNWAEPTCVPTITTISTAGSGTLPQTYCRTMMITITGANGSVNGSFYGGTGAQVVIGPMTGPADTGLTKWTYSVAAGGSGAVTTVTDGAVIQTHSGVISVPAGANATGSANGAGGTAPTGDEAYGGTAATTGWAVETSTNGTTGGATGGAANGSITFTTSN